MNRPATVSDVDESTIVGLLNRHYPRPHSRTVEAGIGDDAAILAPDTARQLVTVDTLVDGKDFLAVWPCGYRTGGADVGWKSAAQNLSDINGMGGTPTAGFVTLSLPDDTALAWLEGYARGVAAAATELGAGGFGIAGGDLSSASELQVGMTVLGRAERPITRSGARPGDRVVLAGAVPGMADVGLSLLLSEDPADAAETWGLQDVAVAAAQLRPCPPLRVGPAGDRLTALMDVSDGLVRDASRLATASGLSIALDPAAVEQEQGALIGWGGRHVKDAQKSVLYGGEDFGLLGTSPAEKPVPEGFRQIGTVMQETGKKARTRVWLGAAPLNVGQGFDHFHGHD